MLEQEFVSRLASPVSKRDHMLGDINAPIIIVEYGDYQCPFCAAAYVQMKRLRAEVSLTDMCYVFRNFPLKQAHPNAQHAAEAAEIAGEFGKFWEMHGLLFENQGALDDHSLAGYAKSLGIDHHKFESALTSHTHAQRVHEDFMSGVRSGVNGTPSFFVNNVRFDGSVIELVAAIEADL
ncbi:MAG TPA: thioredoxin domain-containing protein [Drouetiella sp.]|jgi:protein-disulfide isomerase